MVDVKCKYEVCTCSVPHDLCPHPLGWASEDEVRSLAERLCGTFDRFDGFPMTVAREALIWRDETRPVQAPPAAVPAGYVSMPVERVQHVIDLLAERAHLNNARSPAHNARLLLEATLTAANKENGNG